MGAEPMRVRWRTALAGLLALSWLFTAQAATKGDDTAWFDEPEPPAVPQAAPGELLFFTSPPATLVLQSLNRLFIDEHSLGDGWVRMQQCYRSLDPVPDAEIVYAYSSMRGLRIESQAGIGKATAEGAGVQLEDVGKGAELCVAADVQILTHNADGSYTLRNGPFHRRFLDGYFPMRVTLDVQFPPKRLRLLSVSPVAQPGFSVAQERGRISIDSLFAGALTIEVIFAATATADD
jgi:hypothetical protein